MSEEKHFPELTDAEKIRWRAVNSDMAAMTAALQEGTATPEDFAAALNRLTSHGIDGDTLTNALHIPDDAGPYAQSLSGSCAGSPMDGDAGLASTPAGTRLSSPSTSASPGLTLTT